MPQSGFIFATCQIDAETALKTEIAHKWPAFRLAFSRPGFLTFKLPPGVQLQDDLDLHSVFARTHGFSLGKVMGATNEECAAAVVQLIGEQQFDRLHVWQRDLHEPGFRGYEPGPTPIAADVEAAIRHALPLFTQQESGVRSQESAIAETDVAMTDDSSPASACGLATRDAAAATVSQLHRAGERRQIRRADSRLRHCRTAPVVDRLPPRRIDPVALARRHVPAGIARERRFACVPQDGRSVGVVAASASPWRIVGRNRQRSGGASQALLNHGLKVIGIDPANMDPVVLANPNFTHWKKRGADVRRANSVASKCSSPTSTWRQTTRLIPLSTSSRIRKSTFAAYC